ncbi:MAG TPA: hypothetical protein VHF47_10625 [Acidimicrobiales bacterium]|nr:hypothetical protein [Acidimicrobiales bacterium]
MLTEPIGPRSPDEILAVVYHRTERARRRRRQQMSAAAAVLAFGMAGLLTLRSGDDEASRVRVIDGNTVRTEESTDTSDPPATAVSPTDDDRAATATASPRPRPQATGPGKPAAGSGDPARVTPSTVPPLPTTTTLPESNAPGIRSLAQVSDAEDDAVLPGWYYDIVSGSMQLDPRTRMVVFTTRYAAPGGSGDRADRTLRSGFEYEGDYVTVDVTEADNVLGAVELGGTACSECTRSFDVTAGTLTVNVPIASMDSYLQRYHEDDASIERAAVSALHLVTTSADLGVRADETEGAQ